ncbi:hypothetical protein PLICRDRAFT_180390 [Plicaturopsis crispa FD-325 SS-3]|uniref:Uncharacterized protein n=1 Tax=Plicaturopsis crispa FD-325 SS-3 TaxID=944288 RepID=A0A0C9SKC3_PLICR|nr:hypothetical protein PLICRDRAFT_180390 [Plicaturopsis crispa FD-325 SS-3]
MFCLPTPSAHPTPCTPTPSVHAHAACTPTQAFTPTPSAHPQTVHARTLTPSAHPHTVHAHAVRARPRRVHAGVHAHAIRAPSHSPRPPRLARARCPRTPTPSAPARAVCVRRRRARARSRRPRTPTPCTLTPSALAQACTPPRAVPAPHAVQSHPGMRAHAACMPKLLAPLHGVRAPPHRSRAHRRARSRYAHTHPCPRVHAPPLRAHPTHALRTRPHSVRAHVHTLRARRRTPRGYPRLRLPSPSPAHALTHAPTSSPLMPTLSPAPLTHAPPTLVSTPSPYHAFVATE